MSDKVRLWCWVQDDEHRRVFPVEIERRADIFYLKAAIKAKKPSFRHIAADSLELFQGG
jgi:Crinkler effector protein N-terminal domain